MFERGVFVQVKPKVVKSVHYCPATEKTIERTYTDLTSLDAYPSTAAYPTQVLSRTFFFKGYNEYPPPGQGMMIFSVHFLVFSSLLW